jgi:hypothetical protein
MKLSKSTKIWIVACLLIITGQLVGAVLYLKMHEGEINPNSRSPLPKGRG